MGFDYRVEIRNKKGKVAQYQPYRMKVDKNGTRLERPPGSGNWYNPDGTLLEGPIKEARDKEIKEAQEKDKKLDKILAQVEEPVRVKNSPISEQKVEHVSKDTAPISANKSKR